MLEKNPKDQNDQTNLFSSIIDLFFPFWPLLAVIVIASMFFAWGYLKYKTPSYGISATLIIKDENKGVDDAKMVESMNPFDSKKIVENEIMVIQSRDLMKKVVNNLNLYAPVFEEKKFLGLPLKSVSAYNTSPIQIVHKNPDKIFIPEGNPSEFYFTYDSSKKRVSVDGKTYPLNKWVQGPFGNIKFIPNEHLVQTTDKPLFFTFYNQRAITQGVLSSLEVIPPEKLSTVINLYYEDVVPGRGEDILNNLIATYNQKAVEDKNNLADNTMKFIESRIQTVEDELDALETEIQQFRSSKGVVNLSEQGRLYLRDAGDNDRRIADQRLKLSILNKVESYIISKDAGGSIVPSTLGITDPVLTQLLQKLYDSEIEYERLKKTTGANNPLLTSVANEIEKIRPNILDNVQSQKSNLRASLGNLSVSSEKFNTALKTLPEKERKLLEISRRKEVKNELFAFLLQKREETGLAYVPSDGHSKIVATAESTLSPVSPNSIKIYGITFFLSMGLWIAYVVISEILNKKILFRSEIEEFTDLPIIGEISYVKAEEQKKPFAKNGKLKMVKPLKIKNGKKLLDQSAHKTNGNKSNILALNNGAMMAQLRQMAVKLGLYDRSFKNKSILVTSSIPGEGKSFVSRNLALSLAQSGKKVALLDMDFRKPYLSRVFNLVDEPGIVDYLKGGVTLKNIVTQSTEVENLVVLPAGTPGSDQTPLLLSGRVEILFDELANKYDYIIIDSAPIGLVSDANLLAEYSDIKLLVIRHAVTPKKIAQRLSEIDNSEISENMGIVFNGVKKRGLVKENTGYGYGYANAQEYGY